MNSAHALSCLKGIVIRESLRFLHQRGRFFSALVRPLVWLFIFAAGFRSVLGVSIIPPYQTYVLYEEYITPGLLGMIMLFNGMQSSLSMVYDREMGSMRLLLVTPLPRWYLLLCKLLAGVAVALLQVYVFLAPAARVFHRVTCIDFIRAYAGCFGVNAIVVRETAGELCGRDEFCYLPDVLCILCAIPIVEN